MDAGRTTSKLTRRHFIITAATAAGGSAIGIGAAPRPARAATVMAHPWNDDQAYDGIVRIDGDPGIDVVGVLDPLSAIRDGAGQHDLAADDHHRGTVMRLVEGSDRICFAQPQWGLGRLDLEAVVRCFNSLWETLLS